MHPCTENLVPGDIVHWKYSSGEVGMLVFHHYNPYNVSCLMGKSMQSLNQDNLGYTITRVIRTQI